MKAVVYSGPNCVWCDRVMQALDATHLEVEKKMISDKGVMDEINEIMGKPIRTVPQVVIGGNHIGGYADVEEFLKNYFGEDHDHQGILS